VTRRAGKACPRAGGTRRARHYQSYLGNNAGMALRAFRRLQHGISPIRAGREFLGPHALAVFLGVTLMSAAPLIW